MARLILAVLLLAVAVVVLVLGYLQFADLNKYKALLEAEVAEATGREFTLEEMDLELLPALRFVAHGVSLASPDWASEPQMLQLGTLVAVVKPASLLFGPPQIESITLEDVVLLLETDPGGDLNWSLDQGVAGAGKGSGERPDESGLSRPMPVKLGKVTVSHLLVKRRQPGRAEQQLARDELEIKPEAAGVMELAGSGKVGSLVFDVAAGLARSREEVAINPLRLRIGSSDIGGSIRLDSDGFRLNRVDLTSKKLDLVELLGEEGAGATSSAGTRTSHPASAEGKGGYIFVDDPLPLEQLRHYAMEFRLSVEELVGSTVTLENLNAAGSLRDAVVLVFVVLLLGLGNSRLALITAAAVPVALARAGLDVFGVHGVGGIVGAILTGVCSAGSLGGVNGDDYSIGSQVWIQTEAVVITIVWSAVVAFIAYKIADMTVGLRVEADVERQGLDLTSHGEQAYHG